MQAKTENRNQFVDIMRGIAMLLVVLGHTMTGCTVDSQKSFLFNIIWSLQMPLFILISGFVTKYSRPISDGKGLWKYVKRRTVAYMLPWVVWSFLVRGIIFGEDDFLNVKHLLWNMDSGYWFHCRAGEQRKPAEEADRTFGVLLSGNGSAGGNWCNFRAVVLCNQIDALLYAFLLCRVLVWSV